MRNAKQNRDWLPQISRKHGEKGPHEGTCPSFLRASEFVMLDTKRRSESTWLPLFKLRSCQSPVRAKAVRSGNFCPAFLHAGQKSTTIKEPLQHRALHRTPGQELHRELRRRTDPVQSSLPSHLCPHHPGRFGESEFY